MQAGAMVFSLIRGKVLAVALGAAGVGVVSLIDQVVVFLAQLAACSLPVAGVKFLSAADSESREEFERDYSVLFWSLLFLSLAGTALAIVILFERPELLGQELARYREPALLGLLSIPAVNLTVLLTNTLAATRRIRASGLYSLANAGVLALFCTIGIAAGGIRGLYLANLASTLTIAGGGLAYLWRKLRVRLHRSAALLGERNRGARIARFSATMYATSFSSPLSDLLVRTAVLHAGGLATTGLFQAASGLGLILRTVLRPSFSLFLTPLLNRRGEAAEKVEAASAFLRSLMALMGLGALPLVLFPEWWLRILYSGKFEGAAPAVYLYVTGVAAQTVGSVFVALLLGLDDTAGFVKATLLSDLATAVFAWRLAPLWGVPGVGVAFILDGVSTLALAAWWLWSHHRVRIDRAIGWLPPALLSIVCACGWLAPRWSLTFRLGLCAIVCGCLFRVAAADFWQRFRQRANAAG
jgi:O-antigen/teichoic acid export membrane protein